MSRIALVTGAAGFIGRHTALALSRAGWTVRGLGHGDWPEAERAAWGVERWLSADVTLEGLQELAASGEPQAVWHCAGGAEVSFSLRHPREDFKRTVHSALEVLEFARELDSRPAVVLTSSAAVYGHARRLPIRESDPLTPFSPYGAHKLMVEDLGRSFAAHWGVRAAIVRLFSVYGAGLRKQLLWDACRKAATGEFSFFGTGEEMRDWLHVRDAASLLVLAGAKAGPDCPTVNGGLGLGVAVRDILTRLGALCDPPQIPVFTGQARQGDPQHYVADTSVLKAWGFAPCVDLDEGLREYVEWFRRVAS